MNHATEANLKASFHKAMKYPFEKAGMVVAVIFVGLLVVFAVFYFSAYANPYMQKNMADISDGWSYGIGTEQPNRKMGVLHQVDVPVGERLQVCRVLNEKYRDAALMLKSNHQRLRLFLDGALLFESPYDPKVKNPGMGLHFVSLPQGYEGKLLRIEIISPYEVYSGAPGSVYIGDIPSLQTFALFRRSLPHVLLMAYCLLAGGFMIALALPGWNKNAMRRGNFFFGVFSVLWGFYFPSVDYIAHQVFSPQWVSFLSIGLYYLYPLPLMLYFYSQFSRRRQRMFFPAIVLMGAFAVISFGLQIFGIRDFPEMLNVYNPLYISSAVYMLVLGFTEMKSGSSFIKLTVPWMTLVFFICIRSMLNFYTTRIKQDQTPYQMAIFSFIMVVWGYNIITFLHERDRERHNLLELTIQNAALDHINQTKTEFLQDMSHEMKAPLTVIATGIDFADQEIKAEDGNLLEAGGALETIRAETQRLGRMVSSMANLASINAINDNRKRISLASLLWDSVEAFRRVLEQRDNDLTVKIAPEMPDVFVEKDKFAQVVANLLANAAEHTKKGRVTVAADFDDEYITVRIEDTGEGVPPDILAKVFERGVSGRGGTGYGLYICKTIVEAHGGTIKMESEPGKGCVVTFTVPVYGGQEAGHRL